MKKQMKRTVYEAPVTERFQVELEGVFCASAEINNPGEIGIVDQGINKEFDTKVNDDNGFVSGSWD